MVLLSLGTFQIPHPSKTGDSFVSSVRHQTHPPAKVHLSPGGPPTSLPGDPPSSLPGFSPYHLGLALTNEVSTSRRGRKGRTSGDRTTATTSKPMST